MSTRSRASSDRTNIMLVVLGALLLVSLLGPDDAYLWASLVGLATASLITYQELRDRRLPQEHPGPDPAS